MNGFQAATARHDLRLVPAAVALWLGVLLGLLWGWWAAPACGAAAAMAASFLLWWLSPRRPARPDGSARFRWRAGGAALLATGLMLAGPLTMRLFRAEHDPLRELSARGTNATLRVTVTERPKPVHSAGYANQQAGSRSVVITAEVLQAETPGSRTPVRSSGRVVLIAPFQQWAGLLPGQDVTVTGTLAPPRGSDLTVAAVYVRGPPVEPGAASWWQRAAESLRAALRQASSVLSDEAAGLLPGLVVGDTGGLSPQVEREFTEAGLSHLMAVSGSNLAVVAGAVLLLLRVLRLGPRVSACLAGLALVGFVVLAGAEPSVLRAGVMGAVGLLALALGRERSALPALAAAVLVLIAVDPAMAVSFGFALSVLATAGLVLLAPRWAEALARRGVPAGFAEGLAVPMAAFVVTAPVIAGMAGQVSVVSIAANILAAPAVPPATVLGVVTAVLATFWPAAARLSALPSGPEAEWLILVARHASRVPGAVLPWPGGWWGGTLALVAVVAVALALRRPRLRIGLALGLVCVLLVVVPVQVIAPGWPPARWSMVACDVGQGDTIVLATAEPGRAVVVDTGPEPGPADDCLARLGIDRVPLLVLSHLHADHIGGLDSVLAARAVGAVAVGPGRMPGWAWRQVAQVTARRGVPLLELDVGQQLDWPGLSMRVLGPRYVSARQEEDNDGTDINNASVVLRAITPAGGVLLTGDMEFAAQDDLLAAGTDLHADVLKVPHHGSRFSLPLFLAAVAPRLAIISVGAGNSYGHPNKSTVDTLVAAGALVARTDTGGDTAVVPDETGPAVVRRGR
ncbi:MAG TPA: ComEC/Rec2 family competence protein [Amycolatopsis sp.]|uniref:ComEC/Rec2 family competence protein n=1 Tax=Amycolatopsis sp. TaxID=37632 RepID=UPI002B464480|nr:ComEC/Rec2 family competence protein [Amycolatopsis sp.]HKS47805.1 ComEC/Rec2 family competence protein [Amycolatopsis sp.]